MNITKINNLKIRISRKIRYQLNIIFFQKVESNGKINTYCNRKFKTKKEKRKIS